MPGAQKKTANISPPFHRISHDKRGGASQRYSVYAATVNIRIIIAFTLNECLEPVSLDNAICNRTVSLSNTGFGYCFAIFLQSIFNTNLFKSFRVFIDLMSPNCVYFFFSGKRVLQFEICLRLKQRRCAKIRSAGT